MSGRSAAALERVRGHPRHLVLAGAVGGLLMAPVEPPLVPVAAALIAAIAGRPLLALAAAAAVLGGATVASERLHALDRSALRPLLGREVAVRATVLEPLRRSASGARAAQVRLTGGSGRGERVLLRVGRRARIPPLSTGAVIALRGRLRALRAGEDYQRRRGAHAVLVAGEAAATGEARGGIAGALDGVRARAERAVAAGMPSDVGALARGMVLGEDERLTEPVRDDFRRSGLAHLLAASGQNVMLLAALALPFLGALGLPLRARLGAVLGLIAVYVPVAGAGPSIQRAGIMGAAGVVAALAGRPSSRWYALLLATALTLAINPRAAADPGWQLSFAAVVGILALASPVRERLVARRVPRALAEAAALTSTATLATAPLIAFHFGRLSLASLPANLLAVPAVAPAMWLGMIAAVLGQVATPGAALVNALAEYPLAYVGWLAHATARLPGASAEVRLGSPAGLAAVYAGLAALLASRRARRVVAVLGAGTLSCWALLGGGARPPPGDPANLTVSFLDVGQGDATLVRHGPAAMLVDTGPPGSPLLKRLRDAGVRRVDVLVITHAQADHEGGALAVLERYPVGLLVDGGADSPTPSQRAIAEAAARRRVRMLAPDAGQAIVAGPLRLEVQWPHREPAAWHGGEDPNRRAIVARLRDGDFDLWLPADAESDVTAQLPLDPVEAVKVAHHGSADPGLPGELTRLHPRIAVIEVGRHNPYGHPSSQALAALRAVPRVYRTDRDGTVRLTVSQGRLSVATGT